jgi:AcrR family transcriptional regulator
MMKVNKGDTRRLKSDGPGRRRSEQSHRAILESALFILVEQGYRALTIEGVAKRAGVSKQTIYRWWSSKAAIVLEALTIDAQERLPVPNTGTVRGDLKVLLSGAFRELAQRTGPIVRGLMAEAQLDPEFARNRSGG